MKPAASRAFDLAERLLCFGLYAWLFVRIGGRWKSDTGAATLLILPTEGLVVLFVLVRRPANELSRRPLDWLLAVGATTAPMLVSPGGHALVPPALAATVMLMGVVVQLHAKLTLGRSFGCVAANRGVQLAGPYRFVRHPIYAGYLLSHVGFLLVNPTLRNVVAYGVCYALQIPRLLAEERLLAEDDAYAAYQARVRWRLLPGLF